MAISARSRRSRTVSVGMLSMQLAPLGAIEHRRLAGFHDVLRPAHRGGRVHRHHLAGDQPVEQHPHRGELLLHARRPVFLLQLVHPGRHVERPDGREREAALLAPGEEPAARAGIGAARVGLLMLAVKNST